MLNFAKRSVLRGLMEVEAAVDWLRYVQRGRREAGPFYIMPYRGHGTPARLRLKGRVLSGEPIPPAREEDSAWRNLWHTLRRLETSEVPAARVAARAGEARVEVYADPEGYFDVSLDISVPATECEVWRQIELELLDPAPEEERVVATGYALVPPATARFGVVSDIDDTVVKTDATNILRMLRLVFLTNAHTRLSFEGVAAFYRALHRGEAGDCTNPIFYVSSSPWNLYDLLEEVFEIHGIPPGPLFLKDYGLGPEGFFSKTHREHKLEAIEEILGTHESLPFLLLGDSGQKDPEIYREVVRRHPGRIQAIYIRDVTSSARHAEVEEIAREVRRQGVEMVLTRETVAAAIHAAEHGFIEASALSDVRGETRRDEAAPDPLASPLRRSG